MRTRIVGAALATFFVTVQFYTSLAPLSPTPPVGYVFTSRAGAAALVGILAVAAAVVAVALVRERAPLPGPSRALLGAWLGSALLSSLLGLDPLAGLQVVGMMLLAATFHVGLVRYFQAPGVARTVLGAYLAAGLAAALAALVMVATRVPAPLWALNHGRAAGVFVTANQCAAFLIGFVFVALGVALAERGTMRLLGAVATAAGAAALAATESQAGWIGAAAAGIFLSLGLGARRLAAVFALAIVAVGLGAAWRPTAGHNPAEAFDRLRIWRAGLRVAELFPLTGVGPMAYWRVYPVVRPPNGDPPGTFGALHPHDVYLSLAGETGLVGLAALGFGWARIAAAVRAGMRRAEPRARRFALGVSAALVAVLVQGLFDTVGVVAMTFVWIPYAALALAAVDAASATERS
jgi:O-antigen ligase